MSKSTAKRFWQWLSRQPDDPEAKALADFFDSTDDDPEKEPATVDFTQTPEWKALQKKIADQEAQIANFTKTGAARSAELAVAKLKGKIVPAQKPALLALFTQAAQDDADNSVVTFSVEGAEPFKGSRVDTLLAVFGAAPGIALTTETLEEGDDAAKFAAGGGKGTGGGAQIDPQAIHDKYYKAQTEGK